MSDFLGADFWEGERQKLLAILKPRLAQAAFESMRQGAAKAFIVFDNEAANLTASAWAETYTDAVLSQLMDTTVTGVGDIVSAWIAREGATVGELQQALQPMFGAVRSSRIAVTEITRAFAEGETIAYQNAGIDKWRWNTNHDGIVCKVCAPLNGKVVKIGEPFGHNANDEPIIKPPDGHPNCRCWVSPIVEL
jgi:SPP1 gp7 family putative phage head morphogenesis protein